MDGPFPPPDRYKWFVSSRITQKRQITLKKGRVLIHLGKCGPDPEEIKITFKKQNAIRLTYFFLKDNQLRKRSTWFPRKSITLFPNDEFPECIIIPIWLADSERWYPEQETI